jgi:hypothetical protein
MQSPQCRIQTQRRRHCSYWQYPYWQHPFDDSMLCTRASASPCTGYTVLTAAPGRPSPAPRSAHCMRVCHRRHCRRRPCNCDCSAVMAMADWHSILILRNRTSKTAAVALVWSRDLHGRCGRCGICIRCLWILGIPNHHYNAAARFCCCAPLQRAFVAVHHHLMAANRLRSAQWLSWKKWEASLAASSRAGPAPSFQA